MSIIHEALKKAQAGRSKNDPSIIDSNSARPITAQPNTTRRNLARPLLVGSLIIITGLAIFWGASSQWIIPHASTNGPAGPAPANSTRLGQSATSRLPSIPSMIGLRPTKAPNPKPGELLLSGIVLMDGKNFALINNEFYQTGETIGEARIVGITSDTVDIEESGAVRTMRVLRPE